VESGEIQGRVGVCLAWNGDWATSKLHLRLLRQPPASPSAINRRSSMYTTPGHSEYLAMLMIWRCQPSVMGGSN